MHGRLGNDNLKEEVDGHNNQAGAQNGTKTAVPFLAPRLAAIHLDSGTLGVFRNIQVCTDDRRRHRVQGLQHF